MPPIRQPGAALILAHKRVDRIWEQVVRACSSSTVRREPECHRLADDRVCRSTVGYSAEQMVLGYDATRIPIKTLADLRAEHDPDRSTG